MRQEEFGDVNWNHFFGHSFGRWTRCRSACSPSSTGTTCSPPLRTWTRRAALFGFSAGSTSTPSYPSSSTWSSAFSSPSSPTPTPPSRWLPHTRQHGVDVRRRCSRTHGGWILSTFFSNWTRAEPRRRSSRNSCRCATICQTLGSTGWKGAAAAAWTSSPGRFKGQPFWLRYKESRDFLLRNHFMLPLRFRKDEQILTSEA